MRILPSWAHFKYGTKVLENQAKHGDNKFPTFSAFVIEIVELQCQPVLIGVEANVQDIGHQKGSHSYREKIKEMH